MNLPARHRHKDWRSLPVHGNCNEIACLALPVHVRHHRKCGLSRAALSRSARPRHRKVLKAAENDETTKQHDEAIKELTGVLRGLVGPVTIKGLPAEAKSNVDTLY